MGAAAAVLFEGWTDSALRCGFFFSLGFCKAGGCVSCTVCAGGVISAVAVVAVAEGCDGASGRESEACAVVIPGVPVAESDVTSAGLAAVVMPESGCVACVANGGVICTGLRGSSFSKYQPSPPPPRSRKKTKPVIHQPPPPDAACPDSVAAGGIGRWCAAVTPSVTGAAAGREGCGRVVAAGFCGCMRAAACRFLLVDVLFKEVVCIRLARVSERVDVPAGVV